MKKLITDNRALSFYQIVADNIEKYRSRQNDKNTSRDVPLFVDQIGRLRELFEKILGSIEDDNVKAENKYGSKLNIILNKYPPENKNVADWIFDSWDKVNKGNHYWKLHNKGEIINYELRHYKLTIKNISEFISEYSGISVPEKIFKFYNDVYSNKQNDNFMKDNGTPSNQPKSRPVVKLTPRQQKLVSIPDTRLPILLVLDVSYSMDEEERIDDLNKGVKYFYKSIATDEITSDCIELSVITFGHEVDELLEFSSLGLAEDFFKTINLEAIGTETHIGEAMLVAMESVQKVKTEYKECGISYHQPWIVLITDCDGQAIDDFQYAAQKVSEIINRDKLVLFPIVVGLGNLEILKAFSPNRDPLLMRNKSFTEFFEWLQKNALFFSQSRPDEVKPLTSPQGWSQI